MWTIKIEAPVPWRVLKFQYLNPLNSAYSAVSNKMCKNLHYFMLSAISQSAKQLHYKPEFDIEFQKKSIIRDSFIDI